MHTQDQVILPGAQVLVHVERAYDFDEKREIWLRRQEDEDVIAHNLITNTGRVQLHTQCYDTSGLLTNGFNWIALSNDESTPSATDILLLGEISGNGLSRTQGSVMLPTGSGNQTTITNTFTYTGAPSQGIQKTALFTVPSLGVMCHEISFTQRTLFTNDTIELSFFIQLG